MKKKSFLREMFSMDDLDEDYEDYEEEALDEEEIDDGDDESKAEEAEAEADAVTPEAEDEDEVKTSEEGSESEEPETAEEEAAESVADEPVTSEHAGSVVDDTEEEEEDVEEEPEEEEAEAYEDSEDADSDPEYEDDEEDEEDYEDDEEDEDDEDSYRYEEEAYAPVRKRRNAGSNGRRDDDEDSYYRSAEYKRERRHKRRVRNQLLAFLALAVVVLAILFAIMQLGSKLFGMGGTKPAGGGDDPQTGETSAIPALETEESVVISEPESTAPEEVLTPLDQIVTAAIAEMPIEDKVSALFFVTPEQLTGVSVATQAGNTTQEILQKYKVGGLLYTGKNAKSDEQLTELLSKTSSMDPGVFRAIADQCGDVSPIAKALKKEEQPAPLDIALSGGTDQATASGSAIGAYLKEYGFNLDLAPVADVAVDSSNTYLGKSSFGPDGNLAGQMSAAFIEGLASQGVSSCIVAFPGYGAVSGDEKEGMTTTARTREEMESAEFIAYKAAVNAGAEFLQIGTISAPGLTGDNTQCCLSGEAVRVVREDLGFEGVIVTGALNTAATTLYYDPADAAVRALKAGCDMIYLPEKFEEAYNGVLEAVQNGVLTQERIDESLIRIYRVKYKDRVAQ